MFIPHGSESHESNKCFYGVCVESCSSFHTHFLFSSSPFWPLGAEDHLRIPKGHQNGRSTWGFSYVKAQVFVPQKSWTLSKISGWKNIARVQSACVAHLRAKPYALWLLPRRVDLDICHLHDLLTPEIIGPWWCPQRRSRIYFRSVLAK